MSYEAPSLSPLVLTSTFLFLLPISSHLSTYKENLWGFSTASAACLRMQWLLSRRFGMKTKDQKEGAAEDESAPKVVVGRLACDVAA